MAHIANNPTPLYSRAAELLTRWALPFYVALVLALSILQVGVNSSYFHLPNWKHAAISGTDGQAYYAFARSLVIDRDLDFQNEFYEFNYNKHGFQTPDFLPRSPRTGLIFNRFPVGFAFFFVPFFLLAHAMTLFGNALGVWHFPADGYSACYQLVAAAHGIFWGALAFWSLRRVLERFFKRDVAAVAALTLFLSFPGLFSVTAFWCNPMMMGAFVFNLMLLLAFRVEDGRDGLGVWVGLGALTGFSALLRTETAFYGLLPLALFVWRGWQGGEWRRQAGIALVTALAAALAFLPQLVAWRVMWGAWFQLTMNNSNEGFNWAHPEWWRVLFSTRHGLFYWSPVMLAGLVGLIWFLARGGGGVVLRAGMLVLLAGYYLYASWKIWWMGYSFGARQFIGMSALFGIGLAYLLDRFRHWRFLAGGMCAVFAGWNMVMWWLFLNGHIPRDGTEAFSVWLPLEKAAGLAWKAVTSGGR